MSFSIFIFIYIIPWPTWRCTQNLETLAPIGTEKSGKIEKEGKMSFSIFIFIYIIHLAYLKVYTKFENTGSNRN